MLSCEGVCVYSRVGMLDVGLCKIELMGLIERNIYRD